MSFFDAFRIDEEQVRNKLEDLRSVYEDAWLGVIAENDIIIVSGEAASRSQRKEILDELRGLNPDLTAVVGGGFRVRDCGDSGREGERMPSPARPFSKDERALMARRTTQRIYRVQVGDTLESIGARFFGDDAARVFLAAANGELIGHPGKLQPGWVLTVPEMLGYTVRSGDTLESLAEKFYGHAAHSDLISDCNIDLMQGRSEISPGAFLRIPIKQGRDLF